MFLELRDPRSVATQRSSRPDADAPTQGRLLVDEVPLLPRLAAMPARVLHITERHAQGEKIGNSDSLGKVLTPGEEQ